MAGRICKTGKCLGWSDHEGTREDERVRVVMMKIKLTCVIKGESE